ncbi:MAG: carbamoyltransferase HypF [Clostridiales bacterium]|nr:carbamoyltransferase HypF [Clostridiales bacterium]
MDDSVKGKTTNDIPDLTKDNTLNDITLKHIRVYGIVQGVGFRPFVSRIADRTGVTGSVANKGSYVEIFARGTDAQQKDFLYALEHEAPERSAILKIDVSEICDSGDIKYSPDADFSGNPMNMLYDQFSIIDSEREEGDIFVSPDIATCPKCREELFDPSNRRYMHPFINCTACGPRLTILDAMPYDRERTSMKEFPMCPECEFEYTHAETRRYDAQPVCCNDCGPEVYLIGRKERGREAITFVRKAILEGKIIAIKGIGGFHLCCDAANEEAVSRLRQLKGRPAKPFAVMMKNLKTVHAQCELSAAEKEILDGHAKPIILLKKKQGNHLADSVAPDNPRVGVMLPYAPVQMLLFSYNDGVKMTADSFVMTSGNVSGAPICRTDEDAVRELSGFCDIILSHNRRIRLRADDSVMSFYHGEPYMIRRSRGYVPLPVMMDFPENDDVSALKNSVVLSEKKDASNITDENHFSTVLRPSVMINDKWTGQVLAVGGELKNTFCIAKNQLFYPSSYVGDMADVRTVQALTESIARMEELLEAKPEIVVCDLHPKYNTTTVAEEYAAGQERSPAKKRPEDQELSAEDEQMKAQGIMVLKIQHHYAHILSCMAENNLPPQTRVIGVSFDGTGYGTDGSIWGGELLLCNYLQFERVGSIQPFLQIGGDASAKEGWRIAVSMINALYSPERAAAVVEQLGLCDPQMQKLYRQMAERKINAVVSTSAGRLFDAVSAILGIRKSSTFEGEASTTLQFRAEEYIERKTKKSCDMVKIPGMEKSSDMAKNSEIAKSSDMTKNSEYSNEKTDIDCDFPDDIVKSINGCEERDSENSVEENAKKMDFGKKASGDEKEGRLLLSTDDLVRFMIEQRLAGEDPCRLAYLFHKILVEQIVAGCCEISAKTGITSCALSGGVFQNQLLLELCETGLQKSGFTVYRHRMIPPNDGGLALGQAVAGMAYLNSGKSGRDNL